MKSGLSSHTNTDIIISVLSIVMDFYQGTPSLSMTGGNTFTDISQDIEELNETVVFKDGAQTITGVKTFTAIPQCSLTPSSPDDLSNKSYVDTKVSLGGDETINDVKTFSQLPLCSTLPTLNQQLANKQYVDNHLIGSYVDLTTNQTIGGNKTFTNRVTGNDGCSFSASFGNRLTTINSGSSAANIIEAVGLAGENNILANATNGINLISATATGGSNIMRTNTGQNIIENTGAGSNIIATSTTGANYIRVGGTDKISITNSVTTINSALTVTNNGAPVMRLNGDNISGLYFAFHPEGTSRRAYMGFPNGGVVNFVTSNEYTNGTISNIINGSNKMEISTTGTVLTNGGHRIVSTGGDSEIEGTRIYNTFYTGGLFNVRFYNGSFSAAKCEITPTSTTLTNDSNTITTTTGANTINSTSGTIVIQTNNINSNGVLIQNTNTGAGGVRIASAGTNGVVLTGSIVNADVDTNFRVNISASLRFDINTNGITQLTNTTLNSTHVTHNFISGGNNKMTLGNTATSLSNNSMSLSASSGNFNINCSATTVIDTTTLLQLKIGGVQKIGCSSVSTSLNNQEIYINASNACYTEANSKIRIYNQSDRNEYRFNPAATIPSSQVWRLYDNGTTNVLYLLQGTSALNGVYLANGANGWSAWSDERIKKNIKPIDTALTDILNLNPVFYNYKGDEDTQALRAGFIAQEVQQVYPDLINESNMDSGDIKNLLGLDMTNLVPYLVKAIQDLNKKIDAQAVIIDELTKRLG